MIEIMFPLTLVPTPYSPFDPEYVADTNPDEFITGPPLNPLPPGAVNDISCDKQANM